MAELHHWYLIFYDIRCPKRWRRAYKLLESYGDRVQYSVFRCWLTQRRREKLRWQLEKILKAEDDLLLIRLSAQCVRGLADYNRADAWPEPPGSFRVL
ncbi:MAG: CRISPR-associated endonuclease Cas2 [Cyanobacteria bacterium P01_G01_bin.54]